MPVAAGFRARAKEVRAYLRSLQSLEANIKPGRSFYRAAAAITASRAAAFIMIYNCVEFATREALLDLRSEIESNGFAVADVGSYWREEIVRAHFHHRLQQGVNHVEFLKAVAGFLPGKLDWRASKKEIPFAGNIDHEELFALVKRIKYNWRPPKSCVGGIDLQIVRKMRNDLAHGNESFEFVGAQFTTADLISKFENIRDFMISFLKMIERYKTRQLYLH